MFYHTEPLVPGSLSQSTNEHVRSIFYPWSWWLWNNIMEKGEEHVLKGESEGNFNCVSHQILLLIPFQLWTNKTWTMTCISKIWWMSIFKNHWLWNLQSLSMHFIFYKTNAYGIKKIQCRFPRGIATFKKDYFNCSFPKKLFHAFSSFPRVLRRNGPSF